MEAIINRAPGQRVESAAGRWLLEARKIGRAALGAIGHVLVHYSRAAILLRGGDRPFRRL
ncbi:MAG TPA: hypothetical protein VLB72_17180 [Burkholderiales bacterium]|nr:hypothetical protein [Burkholderiales bacterium]